MAKVTAGAAYQQLRGIDKGLGETALDRFDKAIAQDNIEKERRPEKREKFFEDRPELAEWSSEETGFTDFDTAYIGLADNYQKTYADLSRKYSQYRASGNDFAANEVQARMLKLNSVISQNDKVTDALAKTISGVNEKNYTKHELNKIKSFMESYKGNATKMQFDPETYETYMIVKGGEGEEQRVVFSDMAMGNPIFKEAADIDEWTKTQIGILEPQINKNQEREVEYLSQQQKDSIEDKVNAFMSDENNLQTAMEKVGIEDKASYVKGEEGKMVMNLNEDEKNKVEDYLRKSIYSGLGLSYKEIEKDDKNGDGDGVDYKPFLVDGTLNNITQGIGGGSFLGFSSENTVVYEDKNGRLIVADNNPESRADILTKAASQGNPDTKYRAGLKAAALRDKKSFKSDVKTKSANNVIYALGETFSGRVTTGTLEQVDSEMSNVVSEVNEARSSAGLKPLTLVGKKEGKAYIYSLKDDKGTTVETFRSPEIFVNKDVGDLTLSEDSLLGAALEGVQKGSEKEGIKKAAGGSMLKGYMNLVKKAESFIPVKAEDLENEL